MRKHNHLKRSCRRKRYNKVMASLAGAALLSTSLLSLPTVKANSTAPSEKHSSTDILTDLLTRSRDDLEAKIKGEVETRVREAINQRINDSIDTIKNNPAALAQAWERSKDFLENLIKQGLQDRLSAVQSDLKSAAGDSLGKYVSQKYAPKGNRVLDITATAYTSGTEDNGVWNDKTHIGTKVRPGIIAVDPAIIPLGSRVYIEFPDGNGMYAIAEDTGGAIKGNRIDIALNNRTQVKNFGIRDVKVHVLEEGSGITV